MVSKRNSYERVSFDWILYVSNQDWYSSSEKEALLLKDEELERLTEALAKEKEAHAQTRKEFADLKEAYKLAEERTENAVTEKEKYM